MAFKVQVGPAQIAIHQWRTVASCMNGAEVFSTT